MASVKSPHTAPLNVFSRLQSYWPSTPSSAKSTSPFIPPTNDAQPRFLKVKIVTWNMHDSLPKGDIEELLGKVPLYTPSAIPNDQLPELPNDENHLFHIVVIAGQECPTPSGIPMGLGAGFKWHDREKDKDKEKPEDKASDRDIDRPKLRKERDSTKRKREEDQSQEHNPNGWTAMCEDWLCNGGSLSNRSATPSVADVSAPRPLARRANSKDPKRGPYQLLTKERLMGIYIAIYVHRDVRPLIKGTSKSAVTAGLIGGRVGNKGGVGISMNLNGTSLLFLNAHLAAHGGKNQNRLANMSKINAELAVDSYLQCDDPRLMCEDITDRFDYTFICGDLNFRLDITRQHADWLIARRDYAQALYFDQLKQLIKDRKAFIGFKEGLIDFPPTFKYDVSRTLRKPKREAFRRSQSSPTESRAHLSQDELAQNVAGQNRDEDVVSIASSVSHSSSSYFVDEHPDTSDVSTTPVIPPSKDYTTPSPKPPKKWLAHLPLRSASSKPFSGGAVIKKFRRKSLEEPRRLDRPETILVSKRHSFDVNDAQALQPPGGFVCPTNTTLNSLGSTLDKGVYDSSNKQRVPSWCDRILWKSSVRPFREEPELQDHLSNQSKSGLIKRLRQVVHRKPLPTPCRKSLPPSLTRSEKETNSTPESVPKSPAIAVNHNRSQEFLQPFQVTDPRIMKRKSESHIKSPIFARSPESPSFGRASNHPYPKRTESRSFVWGLIPSFLSPRLSPANSFADLVPAEVRKPRRGDVVCLSYGTLDDQGMRRLGGRSDHRPVIGSYAVYL